MTKLTNSKYHLDPQEPQLVSGMKPSDPGFGTESDSKAGKQTKPALFSSCKY